MTRTNVNGYTPFKDTDSRVVLNWLCRPGDRVEMAVRDSDEGYCKPAVRNGVQGTVVGYKRYDRTHGRILSSSTVPKAGTWTHNGGPLVQWDCDKLDAPSLSDIVHVDKAIRDDAHNRPGHEAHRALVEKLDWVRPLPNLPFWELDVVRPLTTGRQGLHDWSEINRLRIIDIDYDKIGEVCNDGVTPIPIYTVEPVEGGRGRSYARADELELAWRGPMYLWYNDPSKLNFASLQEEVAFHFMIGKAECVRHPVTGYYTDWTPGQIVAGLQQQIIDVVKGGGGLFGSRVKHDGYKLSDPNLSERCRLVTLEGFSGVRPESLEPDSEFDLYKDR